MEELGIGRPSTYASTLNVLRDREYVRIDKKRLYPEDKGRLVTAFLESFFSRYVEYDFTADLEEKLDLISAGKLEWKDVLRDFWREFIAAVNDIGDLRITEVLDALNDLLGPHIFPDQGAGDRSQRLPVLQRRAPQPQGRQVRRLHRLLQLSRLPLHPPARRYRRQGVGRRRGEAARHRSRDRARRHAPHRPLRSLRPARRAEWRREAETRLDPEGHRSGESRSRPRARAALAAARGRGASRVGQADRGGLRPLRALHPARRQICEPRQHRGGVRGRHQSRREPARREGGVVARPARSPA